MGPVKEADSATPPLCEEGELRGSMKNYPNVADFVKRPLARRLLDGLQRRGDTVIQVYPREGVSWTANALRRRALNLAAGLRALGVRPGDRVSMVSGRHPEYGPLYVATLLQNAAWAPLNHNFDDGDLRLMLGLIEPRVVLAEADVCTRLRPLLAELRASQGLESRLVTLSEGDAWEVLSSANGDEQQLPPPPEDPRDAIAIVACSSGTSGPPKGVAISHYSMAITLKMFAHEDALQGLNETTITTSPGFWVSCLWFTLLTIVIDNVLVYEHGCTEEEFLESIEKHRPPSSVTASNFLLSVAKVHELAQPQRDVSSLRTLMCGGAPISMQGEEFVARVMRADVRIFYGMTELNALTGVVQQAAQKPGSVGTLCPFLRCKVVDPETERAVGSNQEGELRFKGPMLCSGYIKNPQATKEMYDAQGWLRSGDVGHYDDDGYFYVTGRIKDTIKYRGVHVSPVDIEAVLDAHPAVKESAVVGVPHPTEQELPRAYVVLRPGKSASEEELCQHVQGKVASHKWLRGGVVFLDALPKTSTDKISHAAIRKQYVKEVNGTI